MRIPRNEAEFGRLLARAAALTFQGKMTPQRLNSLTTAASVFATSLQLARKGEEHDLDLSLKKRVRRKIKAQFPDDAVSQAVRENMVLSKRK